MFPKQPFCATLKSLPLIEANNRTPYAQLKKINEKNNVNTHAKHGSIQYIPINGSNYADNKQIQ